jgi:mono/diheme cytochrome c family protein
MIGVEGFRSAVAVAILTALVASGAYPSRAEDTQAPASREQSGAALYQQYCGACHGADAGGTGPMAPALREPPPDLTRIASRRGGVFPEAEIERIIDGRDPIVSHGTRDMPVWGRRFTEGMPPSAAAEAERRGQAILLVRYLRSIQVTEAPAGP